MSTILRAALTAALLSCSVALSAQAYQTAVGLRLGSPLALSLKHYLTEGGAVELYGGFRSYGFINRVSVSGAYQSAYALNLDGALAPLAWYWGAGASVYFWNYDDGLFGPFVDRRDFSTTTVGVNGYLGLEYAFDGAPVVLTLDWVPTFLIGDSFDNGFAGNQGGLGVRYILR